MLQKLLCVALGLSWSAAAVAQDQRDDEIFGGEESKPAAPADTPKKLSEAEAKTEAPTDGRSQGLSDSLQIGGRLEVRSASAQLEQQLFQRAAYQQVKTADLYFDTRPNKDLRVFLRTRFEETTQPTQAANAPSSVPAPAGCSSCVASKIDELWFKWDLNDRWFFTYGKQHLKWGSGRLWNPTDFTAREVRDPFALFDRRLGQELLKIHFPQEKEGHNYYAVFQFDDMQRNDDLALALRGEFSVGSSAELALSAQMGKNRPQRLGVDISSALGPFDVNLEGSSSRKLSRTFYKGAIDVSTRELPTAFQSRDRWYNQVLGGIRQSYQYSDDDSITWGAEYFWNEPGYEQRDLELYSLILGQSPALYAGRRYAGLFLLLPSPGSWNETSFYLNAIDNLSDQSGIVRLTGTWELMDAATVELYVSRCVGEYGELCFKIPESYKQLATDPQLSPELQQALIRLPTRQTQVTAGAAVTIVF